MTCSTDIGELLARPVRMAFIEYEARFAQSPDECWWPQDSPEHEYWMEQFIKRKPPSREAGGSSIPHQRDARNGKQFQARPITA